MIATLKQFDKLTAVAILARAALAVDDDANPAAVTRVPGEDAVRRALLEEVRRQLRIGPDDQSSAAWERVGDALDRERDELIGPADTESTLKRLAERGDLPSDLYDVRVIHNIKAFHGKKFAREKRLIELTVRSPDHVQHYGPPDNPNDPFLISLFAKFFADKYPLRSFTLLIAGQRKGLVLDVHQAWRIYPTLVNLNDVKDLVDMLRRFSDVFGVEIELGDQKGHFIRAANLPKGEPVKTTFQLIAPAKAGEKPEKRVITVTSFVQPNPLGESNQVALAIGIDLSRYRKALAEQGW